MANILASGYKDVFLPTTQCISTWRCLTLFSLQAVIVPVGRIALGRILNVVGSIIDPHSQFCHSCQFNNTNQATIGDSQDLNFTLMKHFYFSKIHTQMLIIGTDIFSHHIYFYSLASLYLQHTQHLGTKTTLNTQFSRVKAIHKTPNKLIRLSTNLTLFETGIKVVDLLTPYVQGGKIDLFGGVGERTREGNDLYYEMQDSSIISRTDLPSFHRKNIFTQVHSVNTNE